MERSLLRGLDDRGNEAEAVEDKSGSVLDHVIAREQVARLQAVESDPEQVRFGAVYKLKMLMRCAPRRIRPLRAFRRRIALAARRPHPPSPAPAGRVAAWLVRLRRFDESGNRFKPTSRKIVAVLGMVRQDRPNPSSKTRPTSSTSGSGGQK